MINTEDQINLFKLISAKIEEDVLCYAFGGTAMLFYGYKESTKDIDLIFEDEKSRKVFVKAIELLGYRRKSLLGVYDKEHIAMEGKPVLYTRGDERFDLFVENIFTTPLAESMRKEFQGQYDFSEKDNTLIIRALSKESIIVLKCVTDREKDFDDILTLFQKDTNISWDKITDIAIEIFKKKNDKWVVLDLEEKMQRLKKQIYIPKKYFDKLYTAENK